jgi:hypothetical protein
MTHSLGSSSSPHDNQHPSTPRATPSSTTPRGMTPRNAHVSKDEDRGGGGGSRSEGGGATINMATANLTPGFVGMLVTRDTPHRVLEVADMCDVNGVMQGQSGYEV